MALTVAPVPTGMKAGVRMTPRGVAMAPARALPSRALSVKANDRVMCPLTPTLSPPGRGSLAPG